MSTFEEKMKTAKDELKATIKENFTSKLDSLVENKRQEKYGEVNEGEDFDGKQGEDHTGKSKSFEGNGDDPEDDPESDDPEDPDTKTNKKD